MTISLKLNENISVLFKGLVAKGKKPQKLFDIIGQRLSQSTRVRFDRTKTSPSGKRWKPSIFPTGTTLVSANQEHIKLRKITHEVSSEKVLIGTTGAKNYARIHQLGGKAGRNNSSIIPARPYLGVSKADARELESILNDYFKDAK